MSFDKLLSNESGSKWPWLKMTGASIYSHYINTLIPSTGNKTNREPFWFGLDPKMNV